MGTWEHQLVGGKLEVRMTPFERLDSARRAGVEADGPRLAAFFERPLALYT